MPHASHMLSYGARDKGLPILWGLANPSQLKQTLDHFLFRILNLCHASILVLSWPRGNEACLNSREKEAEEIWKLKWNQTTPILVLCSLPNCAKSAVNTCTSTSANANISSETLSVVLRPPLLNAWGMKHKSCYMESEVSTMVLARNGSRKISYGALNPEKLVYNAMIFGLDSMNQQRQSTLYNIV